MAIATYECVCGIVDINTKRKRSEANMDHVTTNAGTSKAIIAHESIKKQWQHVLRKAGSGDVAYWERRLHTRA